MSTARRLWARQTQLLAFIRRSNTQVKTERWQTEIRSIGRELMRQTN